MCKFCRLPEENWAHSRFIIICAESEPPPYCIYKGLHIFKTPCMLKMANYGVVRQIVHVHMVFFRLRDFTFTL